MLLSRMRKDDHIHPGPFPFLPVPSRSGCRSDKHPLLPASQNLCQAVGGGTFFLFSVVWREKDRFRFTDLNVC